MRAIPISEFKATCLAVIERIRRTGEPVLITKRGHPVAEVVPVSSTMGGRRRLGSRADTARIVADIVEPAAGPSQWHALNE